MLSVWGFDETFDAINHKNIRYKNLTINKGTRKPKVPYSANK